MCERRQPRRTTTSATTPSLPGPVSCPAQRHKLNASVSPDRHISRCAPATLSLTETRLNPSSVLPRVRPPSGDDENLLFPGSCQTGDSSRRRSLPVLPRPHRTVPFEQVARAAHRFQIHRVLRVGFDFLRPCSRRTYTSTLRGVTKRSVPHTGRPTVQLFPKADTRFGRAGRK